MPRRRSFYTAEVSLNGETYCMVTGDEDAITATANHHAAMLKQRQAAIAQGLKIRDLSKVEVRLR